VATTDVYTYGVPAESDFGYAQAIRSGDLIHVSGQVSFGEAGEFLHAGDFPAQLAQTYANMDRVLAHYGATRNQIVSQTVYMVNLQQNAAAVSEGNRAYFGEHRPASTVLGISELAMPGQVIEISFVIDLKLPV
jgi:enamine deaminase RidA (YjgF/YER057c/UK114 family)